jgi:hypothetical protein
MSDSVPRGPVARPSVYLGAPLKPQPVHAPEVLARAVRVPSGVCSDPSQPRGWVPPQGAGEGVRDPTLREMAERGRPRAERRQAQMVRDGAAVQALRAASGRAWGAAPRQARAGVIPRLLAWLAGQGGAVRTSAEMAEALAIPASSVRSALASLCTATRTRPARMERRTLTVRSGWLTQYRLPTDAPWPPVPEGASEPSPERLALRAGHRVESARAAGRRRRGLA